MAGISLRSINRRYAPGNATFALALSLPDLAALSAGSHETPESSATLILQIAALGIRHALSPVRPRAARAHAACGRRACRTVSPQSGSGNHALYPRGVDLVLCAGMTLTALPRSVSIEEA